MMKHKQKEHLQQRDAAINNIVRILSENTKSYNEALKMLESVKTGLDNYLDLLAIKDLSDALILKQNRQNATGSADNGAESSNDRK